MDGEALVSENLISHQLPFEYSQVLQEQVIHVSEAKVTHRILITYHMPYFINQLVCIR